MSGIIKGIKTLLGDVELVPYTVVADHQIYEERLYPARKWVCISAQSSDREASVSPIFRILFNHISGKNKPNIRIDMTTPVTTRVEPGASATRESKFTLGFFIPEEHQENPPDAVDPAIFVENRPEMRVLTRRFGGFATETNVLREAKELAEILAKTGEEGVSYDQYYIAGYDPPYKPISRRNEIWYMKNPPRENQDDESTKNVN